MRSRTIPGEWRQFDYEAVAKAARYRRTSDWLTQHQPDLSELCHNGVPTGYKRCNPCFSRGNLHIIKSFDKDKTKFNFQYVERHFKSKAHLECGLDRVFEFSKCWRKQMDIKYLKLMATQRLSGRIFKSETFVDIIVSWVNKMTKSKIDSETVKNQMPSPRTLARRMDELSAEQRGKFFFVFDCNQLQSYFGKFIFNMLKQRLQLIAIIPNLFSLRDCKRLQLNFQKIIIISGILRKRLPILTREGCVSYQLDHKYIKNRQGDDEYKALGLVAIVASEDGTREPFTLGYIPTDDASDEETIRLIEESLEEYNLTDSFKRLEIPFTTDCGLKSAIDQLHKKYNLPEQNAICTCHNLGNLGNRCSKHLPKYLDNGKDMLQQLKINIEVGRSLDNYFKTLEVNPLDRDHIGELLFDNWMTMTEDERSSQTLKYLKIPTEFTIRFRNAQERTVGLLSKWNELQRIKSNIYHPLHNAVENLDDGEEHFQFLKAMNGMQSLLIKLVNYYECDNNFQSSETINSLIHGFQYSLNLAGCNKYEFGVKLAFVDSLTEQLCSHKAIENDSGGWIWKKCGVPTRIRRMDKVGAFAFPGEQRLILPRLINKLKQAQRDCQAQRDFRRYKSKFQVKFLYVLASNCNSLIFFDGIVMTFFYY